MAIKKRYATSKIISVRYHKNELELLDKKRKKVKRTIYIREKSLE